MVNNIGMRKISIIQSTLDQLKISRAALAKELAETDDVIRVLEEKIGLTKDLFNSGNIEADVNDDDDTPSFGELSRIDTMRSIIQKYNGHNFTCRSINEDLKKQNSKWAVPNERLNYITNSLKRLQAQKFIVCIKKSSGRRPTQYRFNKKAVQNS